LLTNCRGQLTGEKLKRIYKDETRKVIGKRGYDMLKAIKKLAENEVETGLQQLDYPGWRASPPLPAPIRHKSCPANAVTFETFWNDHRFAPKIIATLYESFDRLEVMMRVDRIVELITDIVWEDLVPTFNQVKRNPGTWDRLLVLIGTRWLLRVGIL
jgi:hypothetical protein